MESRLRPHHADEVAASGHTEALAAAVEDALLSGRRDEGYGLYLELCERLQRVGCVPTKSLDALVQSSLKETHRQPVQPRNRRTIRARRLRKAAAALAAILAVAGGLALLLLPRHSAPARAAYVIPGTGISVATLQDEAAAAYQAGDYMTARERSARAIAALDALGDQTGKAESYGILGETAQARGDLAEARTWLVEALAVRRAHPRDDHLGHLLQVLGALETTCGHFADAKAHLRESLAVRRGLRDRVGVALCLRDLGQCASAQNRREAALAFYREAAAELAGHTEPDLRMHLLALTASEEARLGRADAARTTLNACLQYWEAKRHPRWVASTLVRLSEAALVEADPSNARTAAARALRIYADLGDRLGIADARLRLGCSLTRAGRHAEGCQEISAAALAYRSLGASPRASRAERALADAVRHRL